MAGFQKNSLSPDRGELERRLHGLLPVLDRLIRAVGFQVAQPRRVLERQLQLVAQSAGLLVLFAKLRGAERPDPGVELGNRLERLVEHPLQLLLRGAIRGRLADGRQLQPEARNRA